MYHLDDEKIAIILNEIKARGIETEDLQLNLLDHVCCIIEDELTEEGNFNQFLKTTLSRFYKTELAEIEKETKLLITFKHLYTMKKIMFTSGIISTTGIILGSILKYLHQPGGSILLIVGIVVFSFVFLPLMFTLKIRESKERRDKWVSILAIPLCIFTLAGVAFKLMHWPYANILMQSSLIYSIAFFVPVYLISGIRNPAFKVNTIIGAVLILCGSGLLLSLTTKTNSSYFQNKEVENVQKMESMVDRHYSNFSTSNKDEKSIVLYLEKFRNAYYEFIEGTSNNEGEFQISNPYETKKCDEFLSGKISPEFSIDALKSKCKLAAPELNHLQSMCDELKNSFFLFSYQQLLIIEEEFLVLN